MPAMTYICHSKMERHSIELYYECELQVLRPCEGKDNVDDSDPRCTLKGR